MGHLRPVKLLAQTKEVNAPIHLDIHEEIRRGLEENNAFEYWEDVQLVTPATPGEEFAVKASFLNKTPNGYLVIKKSAAVDVYDGDTISARNLIYLKASIASVTITVRVFV